MVSSIALFTTLTALAARSANAMAVQSIMQGSNCLRVGNNPTSAGSITSGSPVTLGECNNNNPESAVFTGQQWLITRGNNEGLTLYGTGLCLDAGSDTPDQNIVVNTCNGSPSQTWWATEDNRIAITGGNQCLEGEGNQATTGACAPGIANQAFTYNLLFDTETATALVPGASSTGGANGVIGVGGATSSVANSVSSAINSVQSSASSAIGSLTGGAVASASSVVNSASSAASAATASASSVVAGAASGASSGVASATGAIGSAASSASSAASGAASSASSGAAGAASSASSGAAGAASSASSGASDATTAAGGLVSSLRSVAATITSGAGAAASSITPGNNAAVSDFHLSKIALLVSAVAIGAAMVI